jgi:hypothetical protein
VSTTVFASSAEEADGAPLDAPRRRPRRLRVHGALRWLHVYISMVSMLAVLFFAVTGVTLNHPDWLPGERSADVKGTMPPTWKTAAGVDWLVVAEHLRSAHGVRGPVAGRRADDTEASISFKSPGYGADAYVNVRDGGYRLMIAEQGALAVLNDLHRGRDSGRAWAWLIDVAGVFLAVLSVTGLGLLWYLKKMRVSALLTMAVGSALVLALAAMIT